MVISRYTAKRISVGIASVIGVSLILLAAGKAQILAKSNEEDDKNRAAVSYTDAAAATSEQHENGILIKDRQKSDEYTRYLCPLDLYSSWCERYHFDTECKVKVSECKVKQGIFYYKLQSDGDEHPYQLQLSKNILSI